MKPFAQVPSQMPRSGIREIMDRSAKIAGAIHLEVGQPDFPTPPHIIEAANQALADGWTKYVANAGVDRLREAAAAYLNRKTGVATTPEQVLITTGAVTSCATSFMVTCNRGDQVLMPDPAWPNYAMAARLIGAEVIPYSLLPQRDFLPDLDELERLVTDRTRLLLICTPSNPTGQVYDDDLLAKLVAFCRRHDIYLLSDEIYGEITFGRPHASALPHDTDGRVILVTGVSKSYSMTGFRIGFTRASADYIEIAAKLQEPLVSCAAGFSQLAACAAVEGPQECVEQMRQAYEHRRDIALDVLRSHDLYRYTPGGAFYLLVDISESGLDGHAFSLRLLDEEKVAVAPGTTFGQLAADHVRISFAADEDDIREGMERLCRMVRRG